jgi:hypothetical protein
MLHQGFEIAPCLVLRVTQFFKTIEAQEFGQLKSIAAVALVGVFGNPGIGSRMRTDNALHQRADNGGDPGGQLIRFQVYLNFTSQISEGFSQIGFTGWEASIQGRRWC